MRPRADRTGLRHARDGFTLLEAAIALAIVGMATAAVLASFGISLRTASRARHALEAEALATQRLAYVSLLSQEELNHLADSVAVGRFSPPFAGYRWETTSKELRGEESVFDVKVDVSWPEGHYALETRLYRPPPMPGVLP